MSDVENVFLPTYARPYPECTRYNSEPTSPSVMSCSGGAAAGEQGGGRDGTRSSEKRVRAF